MNFLNTIKKIEIFQVNTIHLLPGYYPTLCSEYAHIILYLYVYICIGHKFSIWGNIVKYLYCPCTIRAGLMPHSIIYINKIIRYIKKIIINDLKIYITRMQATRHKNINIPSLPPI